MQWDGKYVFIFSTLFLFYYSAVRGFKTPSLHEPPSLPLGNKRDSYYKINYNGKKIDVQ